MMSNKTKTCTKCRTLKTLEDFYKSYKSSLEKFRYNSECKVCTSIMQKDYRERSKNKIFKRRKVYRENNVEKIKKAKCEYYLNNVDRLKKKFKCYREKNKEELAEKAKQYYNNHKESAREWGKEYRKKNSTIIRKKKSEYLKNNRDKASAYRMERYYNNEEFKLAVLVRSRISTILRRKKVRKQDRSLKYLGCAVSELKAHLEKQFKLGMTWDNHGRYGWHVDHIRPLASFNLVDLEQQHVAFNYKNLQPLWAEENLTKGTKYNEKTI